MEGRSVYLKKKEKKGKANPLESGVTVGVVHFGTKKKIPSNFKGQLVH